ncbi:hypothetical protein HK100_009705 [Physocladia obscura]|uniref:Uncharacterized protein n=1 Tax=Physocladia obscura TaxID=109957 RepID=A0AAD5XE41_9FUNG|nr:hypothetical protein HK100_009705 [Physocladia obscura]
MEMETKLTVSSIGSASTVDRPTLQALLEPFAIHGNEFEKEYRAVSIIIARVLGATPASFHTYSIYPVAMNTYVLCMVALQGLPYRKKIPWLISIVLTDNSKLPSNFLRLASIITSLVAQCAYCSALACGLGDIFKGSIAVSEPLRLAPNEVSPNDRIALRLCVAATKVPARVSLPMQNETASAFDGTIGLQQIGNLVAIAGFKNSLNTLLGLEIDELHARNAEIAFKKTAFSFGVHKYNGAFKSTVSPRRKKNSIYSRIKEAVDILVHLRIFLSLNQTIQSKLPTTHVSLDTWLLQKFQGFAPRYLTQIKNASTKRIYCSFLEQTLFCDTASAETQQSFTKEFTANLPIFEKIILAFVYMKGVANNLLVSHFAYIANKLNIPPSSLTGALDAAKAFNHKSPNVEPVSSQMDIMVPLMYYTARRYHKRIWRLTPRLMRACDNNPATVLAFSTLAGTFTLLHRYSAVVAGVDSCESPVKDFVESQYGQECGLKTSLAGYTSSRKFLASEEEQEIDWDDVDLTNVGVAAASMRMDISGVVGTEVSEDLWGGTLEF